MADVVALYDEADRLKEAGKLEEAASKLNEALAIDQDFALAHSALAVVMQKMGKHDEAIEHAEQVTKLEPNDAFGFTALSVTYQRAYAGTGEMQYIQLAEDAMAKSQMIQGA